MMDVALAQPEEVRALRDLHRREMNCQIVLDSWHGRGWVDSYLLRLDCRVAGYGLVGGVRADPKDTVVEFYVSPDRRAAAPRSSAGSWPSAGPRRSRRRRTTCCSP